MGAFLDREPDSALHVYVAMRDRRDVSEVWLRKEAGRLPVDGTLHGVGVPGHDDVGQQRERAGDRGRLDQRAAMPCLDTPCH